MFLFWSGACRIANHPLASWTETPLTLAWAEVWALATEFVFKQIFGRAWPESTYFRDHLDAFASSTPAMAGCHSLPDMR